MAKIEVVYVESEHKALGAPVPRGRSPARGPGGAYLGPPEGGAGPDGTDLVRHGVALGRLSMIVLGPLNTF